MELKKYRVNVKALDNIESANIGINVIRKNKPMFGAQKKAEASGFPITYLSFIEESGEPFQLIKQNESGKWDGKLYYSIDAKNWTQWSAWSKKISSSEDGKLYLRGEGNSYIYTGFLLTENKRIQCIGNIESLLNYKKVYVGEHPVMGQSCFIGLFSNCSSLTKAPELPATELTDSCYQNMFYNCTSLTEAPLLPATVAPERCYFGMFQGCTSLTKAPELPATEIGYYCYYSMFRGCTSLIEAPSELPATELDGGCYNSMFKDCTSLTKAPELPATTTARSCYEEMFYGCSSLITPPSIIAADEIAKFGCSSMFENCTSLTRTPKLVAKKIIWEHGYYRMFYNCTSLVEVSDIPTAIDDSGCFWYMFCNCTSLKGKIHCSKKLNVIVGGRKPFGPEDIEGSQATIVYDL